MLLPLRCWDITNGKKAICTVMNKKEGSLHYEQAISKFGIPVLVHYRHISMYLSGFPMCARIMADILTDTLGMFLWHEHQATYIWGRLVLCGLGTTVTQYLEGYMQPTVVCVTYTYTCKSMYSPFPFHVREKYHKQWKNKMLFIFRKNFLSSIMVGKSLFVSGFLRYVIFSITNIPCI